MVQEVRFSYRKMAPSGRRVIRRRTISTRSCSNKSTKQATKIQKKKIESDGFGEKVRSMENMSFNTNSSSEVLNNGCSTPKGKKFRIPRINKCPPAPMKRRSSSSNIVSSSINSLKRSPIAFFSPPDLELFFFFASSDHTNTV